MIYLLKICRLWINRRTTLGSGVRFLHLQSDFFWCWRGSEDGHAVNRGCEQPSRTHHCTVSPFFLLFRKDLINWKRRCLLFAKRLLLAFGRALAADGVCCLQPRASAAAYVIGKCFRATCCVTFGLFLLYISEDNFGENQSFLRPMTDGIISKETGSEFSKIKSWGSKREKQVKVMNQLPVWGSKCLFYFFVNWSHPSSFQRHYSNLDNASPWTSPAAPPVQGVSLCLCRDLQLCWDTFAFETIMTNKNRLRAYFLGCICSVRPLPHFCPHLGSNIQANCREVVPVFQLASKFRKTITKSIWLRVSSVGGTELVTQ